MDNKLSERSKPAAFIVRSPRGDVAYRTISQTAADYIARKGYASEPLYSQEYVSALLAELEAKDKRIAELELDELAMRASSRAVHEAQENHINQQQDRIDSLEKTNAGLGRGLAAAEKRLAIPVRLPDVLFIGRYPVPLMRAEQVKERISAAGFKCVGDEQ